MADEPDDWQDVTDWQDVEPDAPSSGPSERGSLAQPTQQAAQEPDDWQDINDWEDVPESSAAGSFVRGAARSAAPALLSLPVMGASAYTGAAIGSVAGPIGTGVGGFIGGVAGAFGGGYLFSRAQDWVLDKLGLADSVNKQAHADEQQHPYASLAGELAPNLAAFKAGPATKLARAGGAALMGGLDAGQQAYNEGKVDPTKVAMSAGFGAAFPNPTKLGAKAMGAGEHLSQAVGEKVYEKLYRPGRPDTQQTQTSATEKQEAATSTPQTVASGVSSSPPPPSQSHETIGNPKSYPERSAREYPKEQKATGGLSILSDGLSADQKAALEASTTKQAFRPPEPIEPKQEQNSPIDTGIAEHITDWQPLSPDDPRGSAPPPPADVNSALGTPEGEMKYPPNYDREGARADRKWAQAHQLFGEPQKKPGGSNENAYEHPHLPGTDVVRDQHVPDLVGSSEDGSRVYVDPSIPRQMQVNEKTIDPALPMAVREIYTRHGINELSRRLNKAEEKPMTHEDVLATAKEKAGVAAERAYLEEYHGFTEADWNRYQQLQKEAGPNKATGTPPEDLFQFKAPEGQPDRAALSGIETYTEQGAIESARMVREAERKVRGKDQELNVNEEVPAKTTLDSERAAAPVSKEAQAIDAAAAKTNANPTEAQKKSGNYTKGVADVQGIKVAVETARGETRRGKDASGKPWEVTMPDHYGEVEGTRGADGDKVDAFIGPDPTAKRGQIILQRDLNTGKPDEHKLMLNYPSKEAAIEAYKKAFSDGRGGERIMSSHDASIDYIKKWLKSDQTKVAKSPTEITATVKPKAEALEETRSTIVDRAVADAREKGMEQVAKNIEGLDAKEAGQAARKYLESQTNKSGKIKEGDYASVRAPTKAPTVEGITGADGQPVTARSKADAERKSNAVKGVQEAFDKWTPPDGKVPVGAADIATLKERAVNAANDGAPHLDAYEPGHKPASYLWQQALKELLGPKDKKTGEYNRPLTPKRVAEFIATEKQLRSGKQEDVDNVRTARRTEADIALRRTPTVDEAEAGQARHGSDEVPLEEGETAVSTDKVTPADLQLPAKTREIDVSEMSPSELGRISADMEKVAQNIIATFDKKPAPKGRVLEDLTVPDWKAAEGERTAKQAARAAELKALREKHAKPAEKELSHEEQVEATRKPITEEAVKAATEALEKASKKPDRSALTFMNDEGGKLSPQAIDASWKAVKQGAKNWVAKTFGQPISDMMYKVDSLLAQRASYVQQANNVHVRALDKDWYRFTKGVKQPEVLGFLHALETTDVRDPLAFHQELLARNVTPENARWLTDRAPVYRELLDRAFAMEKQFGSTAEYIDNYVPHIFKDPGRAKDFIDARMKVLGPTWFQKHRSFELIQEAIKHGFELKYDNPVDLITHRLAASEDMMSRVGTLRAMNDMGAAFPTKDLDDAGKAKTSKWSKLVAPDHQEWRLSPDAVPIWDNAIEAQGLWNADNQLGSAFRGWMKAKNAWVPVKLALSAFHLLHVVGNVNIAENIARGLSEKGFQNKLKGVLEGAKFSFTDPLLALPLEKLPLIGDAIGRGAIGNYSGKQLRSAWNLPESQRTPAQNLAVRLYQEAGASPQMSEQLRISAKRDLAKSLAALQNGDLVKGIPGVVLNGLRRGIEHAQGWMFEELIPNLKAAQMLRSTEQLLRQNPDLIDNAVARRVALRAIGKSVDDRFGEMFYGSMFWNRTLKDASIGSFLSLGWNTGQFRQAGGAVQNLATKTGGRGSSMQQNIYNATNKGAYVSSYVGLSMFTAGALSYALSGSMPNGLDYFFPRAGGINADGSPRRLTTMFNTREVPMAISHIQEQNSVIGGLGHLIYNKMILSPLIDALTNKDFFGNQLYDPDAPWFKRMGQLVDSTLGSTMLPIPVDSFKRIDEQGGGTRDKVLSVAGFGPAPSYISRSPMQNRIAHAFNVYGPGASSRPYEGGQGLFAKVKEIATGEAEGSSARRLARGQLNRAIQAGDDTAASTARQKLIQTGMSPSTVAKLRPGESDVYMFSRLPLQVQTSLVKDMSDDEWGKFVVRNPSPQMSGRVRVQLIQARQTKP